MNEQDKAAFEAQFPASLGETFYLWARDGWQAALAHRDSQPMVRLTDAEAFDVWAKHCEETKNKGGFNPHIFGVAIMDAMEAKNGGK